MGGGALMSECREVAVGEVCYVSAAGACQTLFASHIYDHDGALMAVVHHDAAGSPVDTSGGTVGVGACIKTAVVEVVYDYDSDSGSCVTVELVKTIDCTGAATVVYLDLAGAPYTPVGTIRTDCPCTLDADPVIVVATTWDGF
jgi:hypothetical protein